MSSVPTTINTGSSPIVPFTISPIPDPVPDTRAAPTTILLPGYRSVPSSDFPEVIHRELDVQRLTRIDRWLWYAAGPENIQPLHRYLHQHRKPQITESCDLHLVWFKETIFIKPLPAWLLNVKLWQQHICSDRELHRRACGFLWTYAKLIVHESDYNLAKEYQLLPAAGGDLSYADLSLVLAEVLSAFEILGNVEVDSRYQYGDLKLEKLNTIYVQLLETPAEFYKRDVDESEYWKKLISRLLIVFAFISLTLTAMQVCLATEAGKDGKLQEICWVFGLVTLLGICVPVIWTVLGRAYTLAIISTLSTLHWFLSSNESWQRRNRVGEMPELAIGMAGFFQHIGVLWELRIKWGSWAADGSCMALLDLLLNMVTLDTYTGTELGLRRLIKILYDWRSNYRSSGEVPSFHGQPDSS